MNVIAKRTYEWAYDKAGTISTDTTFAGMPILIKDMIDVGGVRRTDGSRLILTNIPAENVMYIDGVEAAGMTKGQSCTNFQIGPLKWGCSASPGSRLIRTSSYLPPCALR